MTAVRLPLVLLALLAQLLPLVHFGVVQHTVCAEHGDLVEGERHDPARSGVAAWLAGDADGDDHDHCPLGHQPTVITAPRAPLVVERVVVLTAPAAPTLAVRGVSPLDDAPKQDPPAA